MDRDLSQMYLIASRVLNTMETEIRHVTVSATLILACEMGEGAWFSSLD